MNKSREKTKRKDKKNQPNFFSGGGRFSSLHFILKDIFLLVKRKRRSRGKKELEMSQSSSSWVRRITAGAGAVVQDCLCILYSNNNGEGGKNKRQQQNDDGIWALFVVLVCSHVLCLAFFYKQRQTHVAFFCLRIPPLLVFVVAIISFLFLSFSWLFAWNTEKRGAEWDDEASACCCHRRHHHRTTYVSSS